jgi:formamidopyrimidine-DNA glycosylase
VTQLPEVEVIRKDLEKEVVGKRFKDITVKTPKLVSRHRTRPDFAKALKGRKIEAVDRKGVNLVFRLDEESALVVEPGPQSILTRETATEKAGKNTEFVATFTTGGAMHYSDPTKEGQLYVLVGEELAELERLTPAGVDVLADTFTWTAFGRDLVSRSGPLKKVLKDEDFVVGLGDVYSDEVLWAAGLSAERESSSLSSQEVRRLYRATLEVLHEAVKQLTNTEAVQQDMDPLAEDSDYGDSLKVYGKEGEPCARCRQPIRKGKIGKRQETYYCPQCQT